MEVLVASVVVVDELLAVLRIASLLCRSRSGLSLVSCQVEVGGFTELLVELFVEEDPDVDSGCMLIELRLMKDDVSVVEMTT